MSTNSVVNDYRRIYTMVNKLGYSEMKPELVADITLDLLALAECRAKNAYLEGQGEEIRKFLERRMQKPEKACPPAPETKTEPEEFTMHN